MSPTGSEAGSGNDTPQRSKKLPIEVLRSSAALRAAYIFASATSAIVGATIDEVGITSASKAASR